jgi:hypothetical protein
MKDACRRCCCPSRSLLPLLPIVLSPRWGGDRRCCLDLPPVPSRLFSPLPGRKRKCKLGPTRAPGSCASGTTSITGRRRFPPHVSIMIRLDILFIWGGNHAVRDELQKPRLLISRPILWGFTKYFLTAIRDQIPPPPCRAPCFFFYSSPCSQSCSSHSVDFFSRVPRQALTMGIVSLSLSR